MDRHCVDKTSLSQGEQEEFLDWKFKIVAEAFLDLFVLLEEYAPVWYAEDHHNRALAALQTTRQRNNGLATQMIKRNPIDHAGKLLPASSRAGTSAPVATPLSKLSMPRRPSIFSWEIMTSPLRPKYRQKCCFVSRKRRRSSSWSTRTRSASGSFSPLRTAARRSRGRSKPKQLWPAPSFW